MENVEFTPRVYTKSEFQKIVDINFKEFGKTAEEQRKTVEEFFEDYEELFYDIPAEGESNSHKYLVEKVQHCTNRKSHWKTFNLFLLKLHS